MRRAQSVKLIKDENGNPYAVHLEADHCAEHEWGIERIHMFLEAPVTEQDGIGRYTMAADDYTKERVRRLTVASSKIETYYEWNAETHRTSKVKGTVARLRFGYPDEKLSGKSDTRSDTKMNGAFDSGGFEVAGFSDESRAFIKQLHTALLAGDFAAHMGGRATPFGGGGLNLSIPSLVPEAVKDDVLNAHLDHKRLMEAAKATGIYEIFDTVKGRAEFGYFALSPRWAFDDEKTATDHPVMFWLNPSSNTANYGWFTVEDLVSWTKGAGPVLKEKLENTNTMKM